MEKLGSYLIIILLTTLSGIADAQGFIHASRIWQSSSLNWNELSRSALGFMVGIVLYWLALRYMNVVDIISPEIQTVTWFGVTLISVAFISGTFTKWTLLDQAIVVIVLCGIGWLIVRTNV